MLKGFAHFFPLAAIHSIVRWLVRCLQPKRHREGQGLTLIQFRLLNVAGLKYFHAC